MLKRRTALLFTALLVAYVVVYSHAWPEAPHSVSDSPDYMVAARDLADGTLDALHDRVLGYPLLVLATGSHTRPHRALFFVQLLLHALAAVMLCTLLHELTRSKPLVITLAVVAALPPCVSHAAHIMSEIFTEFLLIASVCALTWGLQRASRAAIWAGALATATSALVRPTYTALPFVFALVLWVAASRLDASETDARRERRRDVRRAAGALLVSAVILVGGYACFNLVRFGYFGTTYLLGFNLCTRTVRVVERLPDDDHEIRNILVKYRDRALVRDESDHTAAMYVYEAVDELQERTGMSKRDLARTLLALNLKLIVRGPMWYVSGVLESMARYWMPSVPEVANFGSRAAQTIWALLGLGLNVLLLASLALLLGALAFGGCVREGRRRLRQSLGRAPCIAIVLATTTVLYTMAISTVLEVGNPRYRAPTDLLALFTTLLTLAWWRRLRSV